MLDAVRHELIKSTLVVSCMTTLSRITGLMRDVVIASLFGAGAGVDAFIVAFRIPNFLRRLFAEGGFAQAFVPVIAEYRESRSQVEVQALIDQTTASLGAILTLTTVVGVIAAPILILIFAPGFGDEPDKQALAASMLRLTFPYLLFISLTSLAGGILNTYRRFAVPAFTPVLLNMSFIGCAFWLAPYLEQPVTALAWAVLIGGVAQLAFQTPFLVRLRLLPRPAFNRDHEGVRRIFRLLLPTLFAISITQINLLIDTLIASFLEDGSISWLYYSDRLVEFPLGVFGIALATVILPNLSAHHARNSPDDFRGTLDWSLRLVLLISLPAAIGLILLAEPALTTLFQYREFGQHDVLMAGKSLCGYAVGLPAFILVKVLATGFFSRQDTRTPVVIGSIAMIAGIIFNLLLVFPLRHAGLALATSLSAWVNAALLYRALNRSNGGIIGPGWPAYLGRIAAALGGMSLLLWLAVPAADTWTAWGTTSRIGWLVFWTACGAGVYLMMARVMGIRLMQMTHHP